MQKLRLLLTTVLRGRNKYMMNTNDQWRSLATALLLWLKTLFLANVTWDFFQAVVIDRSTLSLIFINMGSGTIAFLVAIWIFAIILLAVMLCIGVWFKDSEKMIHTGAYLDYGLLSFIYLMILANAYLVLPPEKWIIVAHYIIDLVWVAIMMVARHFTKKYLLSDANKTPAHPVVVSDKYLN